MTQENDPDEELILRIGQGDRAAMKIFHDRYRDLVFTIALRVCRQHCDAETVVVTVFWEVWKKPTLWNPQRGTARTYLLLLSRSRARDLMRSEVSRSQGQRNAQQELMSVRRERQDDLDPADPISDTGWAARLGESMGSLPDELREAIGLAFLSGYTHVEIAGQLGLPLGTVKTRIRRGLKRMRELLTASEDDWSIH